MNKHKNIEPESGLLTNPMNVENRAFKELELFISNKAKSLREEQKLQLELFALQAKIEDYLNAYKDENQIISEKN